MKYFLKRTMLKKGEYLQIYISEYRRDVGSRNRSFKALGYVEELKEGGIKDPVAYYKAKVDKMNSDLAAKEKGERARKVGRTCPKRHAGYFVLKGVANAMPIFEKTVRTLGDARQFQYDVHDMMMALVYARAIFPASKKKTHEDILPLMFEKVDGNSYSQVLSCCEFIGSEYKKIASYLTNAAKKTYGIDTSETYFDCTNFYFEIDKEDIFRKKGPSKEHRCDPLVGMGILLDKSQIPIGMTLYPGNESEKPKIRQIIAELKKENNIQGKTIQVADKGLNCARNIHEAILRGDGYIFSKSMKKQRKEDLDWLRSLDTNDWTVVYECDGDGEKQEKYRYLSYVETFEYSYTDDLGTNVAFTTREKRIITFNHSLRMKKTLEINRLVEKARNLCLFNAKKSEFGECSKFVSFTTEDGKKPRVELDMEAIDEERLLAGFNMLVTSETRLSDRAVYSTYHNLWRIEQSFRMMKSYLDARPAFASTINCIKGHFLICYIGVVLERLLESHVLGNRFGYEKIIDFVRSFTLVRLDSRNYQNMLTSNDEVGQFLEQALCPQITNFFISPADISMLMKLKLNKRLDDYRVI